MCDGQFLGSLKLLAGSHKRGQGMCFMEAAAYLAGEDHNDRPMCVSPIIVAFGRSLNDHLPDNLRQQLKPLVAEVLFTRTTYADEQTRHWLIVDWAIRVYVPVAMEQTSVLTVWAERLRALPPITATNAPTACTLVYTARHAANAAAAANAADAYDATRAANAATYAAAAANAADAYDATVYAAHAAYDTRQAVWERLLPGAIALIRAMIVVGTYREPRRQEVPAGLRGGEPWLAR